MQYNYLSQQNKGCTTFIKVQKNARLSSWRDDVDIKEGGLVPCSGCSRNPCPLVDLAFPSEDLHGQGQGRRQSSPHPRPRKTRKSQSWRKRRRRRSCPSLRIYGRLEVSRKGFLLLLNSRCEVFHFLLAVSRSRAGRF